MDQIVAVARYGIETFIHGLDVLLFPAIFFALMALIMKRREAITAARRAAHELRINLGLHFIDLLIVLPLLSILVAAIAALMGQLHLIVGSAALWTTIGVYPTLFAAVFLGDFIGYWRHRFEHTSWLWPTHAIHHSDTEMTWLTLSRFHPINRLTTTAIDSFALMAIGMPAWAVVANGLVRHYYGYFIHADLPWTYGWLGKVFVSPAMHRWHHAKDYKYAGTNFATVFSLFDRLFGTFSVPGPCTVELGLEQEVGRTVSGQLSYPFRRWFGPLFSRKRPAAESTPAE